nr:MAG TPA: hypothetical protein [Caudoviricetes sp.]
MDFNFLDQFCMHNFQFQFSGSYICIDISFSIF